jgi:hypothetical protein
VRIDCHGYVHEITDIYFKNFNNNIMKHLNLVLILFTLLSMQSCLSDKCEGTQEFTRYDPVYLSPAQIRKPIVFGEGQPLINPGKLYIYQDYLFINEQGKGVHIFDNSDDSNPINLGYYDIPGNFDIAVRNNILYADNVMDLIAIDISTINSPVLIDRQEFAYPKYDRNGTYLAYYINTHVVQSFDCNNTNGVNRGEWFFDNDVLFSTDASGEIFSESSANGNVSGTGGSTARFTLVSDYLYTIDDSNLDTWYIQSDGRLEFQVELNIGWGIETIFPFEDKLFIGANNGMHIFDNSLPQTPFLLSTFEHARACDPVVASGNTAYVTLRNGSACQSFINQLDVIDITNILSPKLVKTFPMTNPHGLSIRDNILYICEGDFGLRIFDASDPSIVGDKQIAYLKDIKCTDAIALPNNRLLVIGADGFYQYDVTDKSSPKLLSQILVVSL